MNPKHKTDKDELNKIFSKIFDNGDDRFIELLKSKVKFKSELCVFLDCQLDALVINYRGRKVMFSKCDFQYDPYDCVKDCVDELLSIDKELVTNVNGQVASGNVGQVIESPVKRQVNIDDVGRRKLDI